MKRLFLLLIMYGIALSISMEIRPIFFPSPDSFKEAKDKLVGTWEYSSGGVKYEIEYYPNWTYTLKTKTGGEDWKETTGYYEIDTVRDVNTNILYFKESETSHRGGDLYFKSGDKLYFWGWRDQYPYVKNWGIASSLLWLIAVPCVLLVLPSWLLWNKVIHWNLNFMRPAEATNNSNSWTK